MKRITTLLLLIAATVAALGQNPTRGNERWKLAVYVTGDVPQPIKTITQNKVATALTNSGSYQLIERSAEFLNAIKQGQKYQMSGEIDDTQVITLGSLFGAKYVCVVHITLMAEVNYIQIAMRMVDVEHATSGLAGESESGTYQGPTDIDGVVNNAVKQMLGGGAPISGGSNLPTIKQGSGQNLTFTLPSGQRFKMVYVQGGTFVMGCSPEQGSQCGSGESPAHNVTLTSYYMAEYEVTQALWQAVMGTTVHSQQSKGSSYGSIVGVGDNYAMYYINYAECEEFCGRLNNLLSNQLPQGFKFRIPTEAQWEYAARGGVKDKPSIYSGSDYVGDVAWYNDNSGRSVKPVGLKDPNELGIYDMSGNVYEWCADWYSSSYYSNSPQQDPKNLSGGSYRVGRSGSWNNGASNCRVSYRGYFTPSSRFMYMGFRLALVQ
ncbi:MAG TPA: SUMF1/EgtB/PvdO family nonheme iron enzyme [Salinivirgaceae bacterium]|nr:SUMF1/EgtB/PvdO family nonheme iron enzyme [Salinivirgaceae bacterium]